MLIDLLNKGSQIDDILYVDVGDWMWDEAKAHIKDVEKKLGVEITILNVQDEINKGFSKWGFPSIFNRWCTGVKRIVMKEYISSKYLINSDVGERIVQYIGYCIDEVKRTGKKLYHHYNEEYSLVEAGLTTGDSLRLCKEYGFDFGGIYDHHQHFDCWLCPLQKRKELYYLFSECPDKWSKLRNMQLHTSDYYQHEMSIFDFDKIFWLQQIDDLRNIWWKNREKYKKIVNMI